MFIVVMADLNSLYTDNPNCPVVECEVDNEEEAQELVRELQDYETAAWYENKMEV